MRMRVTFERTVYLQVDVDVPDGRPLGVQQTTAASTAAERIRAEGADKFYLASDVPEVTNIETVTP